MVDKRYLVIIETTDGIASGVIISPNGHILTCYHNLYDIETGKKKEIVKIIPIVTNEYSPNGVPTEPIYKVGNNITIITPEEDLRFARKQDLIALLVNGLNSQYYTKLSRTQPIVEQQVSFLGFDTEQSNKIRYISNLQIIDPYRHEQNIPPCFRLSEYGFKGMSGGGVFNSAGELIGIMRSVDPTREQEILASFVNYEKIYDWVPITVSTKSSNISSALTPVQLRSSNTIKSDTIKDVFLCHANEDKERVVRPLYQEFTATGISCWLDEAEIQWGDSIIKKVNEGLANSKYVIIVISESLLSDKRSQTHVNAVLGLEESSNQVKALPLVIGEETILQKLPLLAHKSYLVWNNDTQHIVSALRSRLANP